MTPASHGSDLLVVIVNYRTATLVADCLFSLAPEIAGYFGARVIVVDNASGDGSSAMLEDVIEKQGWSAWASVIRSPVNGGFAYGNNLAIRPFVNSQTGASERRELFWLLNPDTVVRPGAIAAIFAFLADHPKAGAIGTAIDDETGKRWPIAFRSHSLLGEVESALRSSLVTRLVGRHSATRSMGQAAERVDWVSGASVVLRRSAVESIGLLDEEYFLYFEETDYFRGLARAGWECWYVPHAVVIHISGRSTGLTGEGAAQKRVPPYWFASRRRYLVKNHGRFHAIAADLITVFGLCLWRLRSGRNHGGSPHFLGDFIRQSALFRRDIGANVQLKNHLRAPVSALKDRPQTAAIGD
jgi:N-acetylglucosaminyl-diphospho-decaprenol L-rhamnosyltransferase